MTHCIIRKTSKTRENAEPGTTFLRDKKYEKPSLCNNCPLSLRGRSRIILAKGVLFSALDKTEKSFSLKACTKSR